MEYVGYPSHSYYTPLDLWGKANFISITSRTIFDAANVYLLFRIVTFIQIFGHSGAHGVAGNTKSYRVRLENVENSFCLVNNSGGRKHSFCGSCVN